MDSVVELHIVEPGGQGGVYQHTLGAIQNGQFSHFKKVVLHTARDAESAPDLGGLHYCRCMRYQRQGPHPVRASISMAWVSVVLLPHLAWTAIRRGKSRWEIQGLFGKFVYPLIILIAKLGGHRVTWVPHNSFSRRGSRLEQTAHRVAARAADELVIFVESERIKFKARHIVRRRLWMYVPSIAEMHVQAWRSRLGRPSSPIVMFAGQLRPDKNPLLLIDAANRISRPLTVVFVGEDKGAADEIAKAAVSVQHSKYVEITYLELDSFFALISAADLIVCPYAIASQSAVVAVASQLGKKVIASNVGGLGEQTPLVFDLGAIDPGADLAHVIEEALCQSDQL